MLFGHFLEARSSSAAGDALSQVAKLLPQTAHLLVNGNLNDVSISSLKVGDIVRILPGEKVPADGVIIKGNANFNESHLTGESLPEPRFQNSPVIAGAICLDGSVEVKLERVGDNSTIGQIKTLISKAQNTKPTAQRLADRAARVLTFSALTVAIITLFVWTVVVGSPFVFGLTLAITVLVIACPHALGLAIPTVSTIATRLSIKNGAFLKDLAKLEVVKKADTIVFDKTGTLTKGEFVVQKVNALKAKDNTKLLSLAAAVEENSEHSIAKSIVKLAKDQGLNIPKSKDFKNYAGFGGAAKVNKLSVAVGNKSFMEKLNIKLPEKNLESFGPQVFVAVDQKLIGQIILEDDLRPESIHAVSKLHELNLKVAMLTGDNRQTADYIAKKLKIDQVFADVKPEDKYQIISDLQAKGKSVIMVGDGVNDAPALAQADVGVAIGAGTDVAAEAGDIILTKSNPQDIVSLVVLSRRVYRKMIENLFWALGYNVIAIPAAAGLFIPLGIRLTPAIGALLMSLSSAIVVANALSLKNK